MLGLKLNHVSKRGHRWQSSLLLVTSHYLNKLWPSSGMAYGIIRSQWLPLLHEFQCNSLWPSASIWHQAFWSTLIQILLIACHLFGAKAIPEQFFNILSNGPSGKNFKILSNKYTGIILCICPANERRYIVMSLLVGWVHTQNDPWVPMFYFLITIN